ncbi:MAG: bifunctional 3-deoxy-7-phosphoheptulonate synthase/chorismate mutase [Salinivenus sp.]
MSTTSTTTPLQEARDRIDDIDRRFVELLAERYAVVDDICKLKEEEGNTIKDHDREAELLDHVAAVAEEEGLSPDLVRRLFGEILSHSVERQQERRQEEADDPEGLDSDASEASPVDPSVSTNGHARPAPASTADALSRPDDGDADRSYPEVARDDTTDRTVVRIGDVEIGGADPVLIAGPCSVESREQILRTAEAVAEAGGRLLRGGCFKPRTSPYSFQGLGAEGLDLLAEAGERFGLPVITEVLAPGDVAAVAARADVLQIGARNMQNFPLLKAVGRAERPVMLKRGMMATIEEWLSAAEYIVGHGNPNVFLCERGIRTFESATRYTLDLSSVPVVKERTHLPVVVDPSHAAGERRWVPALVRAALGAGAHGVMVEAHPTPEEALSDGPQSLSFDRLGEVGRLFAPQSA